MSSSAWHENDDVVVGARGKQQLDVVLVYEDLSTGLQGRRTLEEIAHQLPLETDFKVNMWRFELLRDPALLEEAAREAARADIVFLSAHGDRQLPPAVKRWFTQCLRRKGDSPQAVAVWLDSSAGDSAVANQMLSGLQAEARRAGGDVFLHLGFAEPTRMDSTLDAPRPHEMTKPILPDDVRRSADRPYRNWGLNE